MPTEAPAKPKQETWLDILLPSTPEPLMISREELLGTLQARGVDVNDITIVFWEKSGTLPRPVRRWHAGAPRAMYPVYAIDAIEHLRQLQAAGHTLEQIAPVMRTWAIAQTDWRDHLSKPINDARDALYEVARLRGIKAAGVRITFTDDTGKDIKGDQGLHIAFPVEWRPPPA